MGVIIPGPFNKVFTPRTLELSLRSAYGSTYHYRYLSCYKSILMPLDVVTSDRKRLQTISPLYFQPAEVPICFLLPCPIELNHLNSLTDESVSYTQIDQLNSG